MIIKEIKFKNMLSNEEEVSLSFFRKFKEEDKDRFFQKTLVKKARSVSSKEGIIKILSLMGKNASYKTILLKSINKILNFIFSIEKYEIQFFTSTLNYEKFKKIYKKNVDIHNLINEIRKFKNKIKVPKDLKIEYSKDFYIKNAFNKDKPIKIMVNFYDQKNKKENILNINLMLKENKFILFSTLNDVKVDLFENKKINNFRHIFISFEKYNLHGQHCSLYKKDNIFFKPALEYLYFEKYNQDINKLISFLKILDPSIVGLKYKILKNSKKFDVNSITREYNDISEEISINELSTGTQVFVTYLYYILKYNFIIIDELDQSLHFKLVELLIDIARNNNKQLIFSTHNTVVINKLIRKYELYILDINSKNSLEIQRADKIFRERDNMIIKSLNDFVSNIADSDLDFLRVSFYD